ncbi:hypothetical protein [Halomonas shantousis]
MAEHRILLACISQMRLTSRSRMRLLHDTMAAASVILP